jgi:hypothetical protein
MSYPPQGGYGGAPPKNNMGLAVAACVLSFIAGCFPLGVFALVQASQVNGKYQRGDVAGAEKSARSARTLSFVSFAVSVVVAILVVLWIAFVVSNTDTTTTY